MSSDSHLFLHKECYFHDSLHNRDAVESHRIDDWDIRDDDVVVVTFPRSGTGWMILALSEMYSDLNWKLPSTGRRVRPCALYEKMDLPPGLYGDHVRSTKCDINKMESPRLLLCHMPPRLFHSKWLNGKRNCKIIYIWRHPKDVCCSLYKIAKSISLSESVDFTQSWENMVSKFVQGKVNFGPWLNHVLSWRRFSEKDNVLHISFEDMKADMAAILTKVAEFLGRPVDVETIERVVTRSSIESMKSAADDIRMTPLQDSWRGDSQYLWKGAVGNWKNHFTVAQNEYFDKYITTEAEKHGLVIKN
ncbi:sulfotransferase 2A1-like [Saccoglossus kowalevskii]|uniref:Amine sulfotransferase-like n=1 Tax=Saccoglossus kowalevskii TaxID=10224 RepID=A0ABM0M4Z5_SACKO|nr:PREDICTED: amine sulfotransferase-like [Saccoglossus kowalevskii]